MIAALFCARTIATSQATAPPASTASGGASCTRNRANTKNGSKLSKYVSATTVTVLLVDKFMPLWAPWTAETRFGNITVATAVAKGVAILVSFVVNFSITHFVVFRARPEKVGERR